MKKHKKGTMATKPHIPERVLSKKENYKQKDYRTDPEGRHHRAEEYVPKRTEKPE